MDAAWMTLEFRWKSVSCQVKWSEDWITSLPLNLPVYISSSSCCCFKLALNLPTAFLPMKSQLIPTLLMNSPADFCFFFSFISESSSCLTESYPLLISFPRSQFRIELTSYSRIELIVSFYSTVGDVSLTNAWMYYIRLFS